MNIHTLPGLAQEGLPARALGTQFDDHTRMLSSDKPNDPVKIFRFCYSPLARSLAAASLTRLPSLHDLTADAYAVSALCLLPLPPFTFRNLFLGKKRLAISIRPRRSYSLVSLSPTAGLAIDPLDEPGCPPFAAIRFWNRASRNTNGFRQSSPSRGARSHLAATNYPASATGY
ncbi:hypothetical protein [Burkholderia multivorans]|uniref:hypothetical protein n=1 Tax=Burkholderia multivorans TaxID=87883 RepID=UPI001595BF75|nr:hypothetical protein [Burkholderia multivorans]